MSDKGISKIIQQAIYFEQDAYKFYSKAKEMVKQLPIKEVLQELADQELEHEKKLEKLLTGNLEQWISITPKKIEDLKLADYLVPPTLDQDATFQDVLGAAMHREKSSFDFYTTMAGIAGDEALKKLFEYLAQEELGHKNKIETIYDEEIYQEF